MTSFSLHFHSNSVHTAWHNAPYWLERHSKTPRSGYRRFSLSSSERLLDLTPRHHPPLLFMTPRPLCFKINCLFIPNPSSPQCHQYRSALWIISNKRKKYFLNLNWKKIHIQYLHMLWTNNNFSNTKMRWGAWFFLWKLFFMGCNIRTTKNDKFVFFMRVHC